MFSVFCKHGFKVKDNISKCVLLALVYEYFGVWLHVAKVRAFDPLVTNCAQLGPADMFAITCLVEIATECTGMYFFTDIIGFVIVIAYWIMKYFETVETFLLGIRLTNFTGWLVVTQNTGIFTFMYMFVIVSLFTGYTIVSVSKECW